jgi:hypothetical protein
MLTKEMFEGRPFEPFVAVVFSRYEEFDPATETITKKFKIERIKEEDFDQYELIGEGTRKGIPRIQRV